MGPYNEVALGLFAFWAYDAFPYLLGGAVTHMSGQGRVRVAGYQGSTFMPVKLVPLEEGRALLTTLEDLRNQHAAELKQLEQRFRTNLEELLLPWQIPITP